MTITTVIGVIKTHSAHSCRSMIGVRAAARHVEPDIRDGRSIRI
jgi:hypothetical protein